MSKRRTQQPTRRPSPMPTGPALVTGIGAALVAGMLGCGPSTNQRRGMPPQMPPPQVPPPQPYEGEGNGSAVTPDEELAPPPQVAPPDNPPPMVPERVGPPPPMVPERVGPPPPMVPPQTKERRRTSPPPMVPGRRDAPDAGGEFRIARPALVSPFVRRK